MLAACGGAAAALVLEDRRAQTAAMVVALVAAPVLVLGNVWDEPRIVDFRSSPSQIVAALAVGALLLVGLTALFRRYPDGLAIAAFAVLPLRVPLDIGGETANLLVPLYLVIAAGVVARATDQRPAKPGRRRQDDADDPWPRRLRWVLAAVLVLYALQGSYSEDVPNAIENIGFFLAPFAILFALLADLEWSGRLLGRVLIVVVAVAAISAVIAIYQYLARDLFLNPELFDANELHVYFRANSLFFDPNILGRHLALAIAALGAYIAWARSRRDLALAALAAGICLVGLVYSYSITSFAALLAGLGLIALLRWGLRGVALAAGFGVVGLAVLVIAGGTPTSDIESDRSIDSGHADLVQGGLDLARDRPVAGFGSGSFGRAFYDRIEHARTTVSHSEPITVAAEQGAIGLIVYFALLVTALVTVLGRGAGRSVGRTAVAACFVVLLVDSLGYTGFATDPAMWALLGLGVALRFDPPGDSATIRA